MKHSVLHSVGHNFADSLAGGTSFIVGCYDLDVFAVASLNRNRSVYIDFLHGTVESETEDKKLANAIALFRDTFPNFCRKHRVNPFCFRRFVVCFSVKSSGRSFTVTIQDNRGKTSSREYFGNPGRRRKTLDHLGRPRPHPPAKA